MSSFLRFCVVAFIVLLLLLGILWLYDAQWGLNDGLIREYAFRNIGYLLSTWVAVFAAMAALLNSRSPVVRGAGSLLLSTVVTLLVLELLCWGLAKTGLLPVKVTNHRLFVPIDQLAQPNRYAGDFSVLAGRWRLPNAQDDLLNCANDSLHRRSNSWGAADVARTATPADPQKKRVFLLGDSFAEGYMVNPPDRMSNLLERQTRLEHLNFGINGSSPINYWLRYTEYGPKLAHDVVMVAVLPANDFQDYGPASAYDLVDYPIYRPYLVGTYPAYQVRYSLANINQSIAARQRTPAALLQTIDSVYRVLPIGERLKVHLYHSYLTQTVFWLAGKVAKANQTFTRYSTFTDDEWQRMQYCLGQLKRAAGARQVVIVSLPIKQDILAIRAGATNQFDPRMARFCKEQGMSFIPLLPHFLAHKGPVESLYVECDGHWSKQGEQFVANTLLKNDTYRRVTGTYP